MNVKLLTPSNDSSLKTMIFLKLWNTTGAREPGNLRSNASKWRLFSILIFEIDICKYFITNIFTYCLFASFQQIFFFFFKQGVGWLLLYLSDFLFCPWLRETSGFFCFLFFLKYLFIYLFMAVLGLRFCARAFSRCGKRGPLFIAVRGPLTITASPVAEHRLQTRRLSNCGSRAQLLRGTWDPPKPGLEPVCPALAGRLSTTAPPGKPNKYFYKTKFIK